MISKSEALDLAKRISEGKDYTGEEFVKLERYALAHRPHSPRHDAVLDDEDDMLIFVTWEEEWLSSK